MTFVYLASFVLSLLLGVRIMISGVERPREQHPSGERSFRLSPPVVAGFALVFGLAGYILDRQSIAPWITLVVAAVLGGAASIVAARLVRSWWAVTPEHDVDDERYVLQGHLARVTKGLSPGVDGEVAFEVGREHRVLAARCLEPESLAAGTDVVIERIEDDIAYVESWVEVEKRL